MKKDPSVVRLIIRTNAQTKICSCRGSMYYHRGMFGIDSYSMVRRVEKLIPVDVYFLGCPPEPEAIIDAIMKLRERKESSMVYEDRSPTRKELNQVLKHECFVSIEKR
jgi:NADH:ubiquinone oxidoreductase subunit B-like Fe-S oxidoreductase